MTGPKVTVIEDAENPIETVQKVTVEILTFRWHWYNGALTACQAYITAVHGAATGAAGGCTMTVWSAALAARVGAPAATATSANLDTIATHSDNL